MEACWFPWLCRCPCQFLPLPIPALCGCQSSTDETQVWLCWCTLLENLSLVSHSRRWSPDSLAWHLMSFTSLTQLSFQLHLVCLLNLYQVFEPHRIIHPDTPCSFILVSLPEIDLVFLSWKTTRLNSAVSPSKQFSNLQAVSPWYHVQID